MFEVGDFVRSVSFKYSITNPHALCKVVWVHDYGNEIKNEIEVEPISYDKDCPGRYYHPSYIGECFRVRGEDFVLESKVNPEEINVANDEEIEALLR